MLKLIPVFTPAMGLTVQECHDYLRLHHAHLCARVPSFNRHMVKYVQNFGIEETISEGSGVGGCVECYFYSYEAFEQAFSEPDYAQFREDELRFGDLERLILVPADPTTVFGPGDGVPPLKVMRFANFREGVDTAAARRFWVADFAREAVHDRRLRLASKAYLQNRPLPDIAHSFPTTRTSDITEEYWLAHRDWYPEFLAAEQELRARTGYDEFFDVTTAVQFLATVKSVWEVGQDPAEALPALENALVAQA